MSIPRRRIVRSAPVTVVNLDEQRRLQVLRGRLEEERSALTRWMSRLKRAFHAVEKIQVRLNRLERQLAPNEE